MTQGEFDFTEPVVPWIAPGTLGRHVLNGKITEAFNHWLPVIGRNGGRLPVGLFEDMAAIVEDYAQVAVREALSKGAAS